MTSEPVDEMGVGRSEGSSDDTAETDGRELCPVPSNEEGTALDRSVGTTTTGVVASVEDPVVVETGTSAPLVVLPKIVSIPTVIPDVVTSGVAASVKLDKAEETIEVIGGMTTGGRRPVDDSGREPVDALGVGRSPLVSELSPVGIMGITTPVLEVGIGDSEIEITVELLPEVT